MTILVRIPTPLRKLTGGQEEVKVYGETVGEVLLSLEKEFPGFRERLFDEQGALRRFVNIYLNDQDIRFLNHLETKLEEGSVISVIPAIAGGAVAKKKLKKKLYLTFPQRLIQKPIIYRLGQRFQVITNIRGASVSEEIGLVALELEGVEGEIEKAIKYLKTLGVKVEPIEKDVVE
ncbi:MAG: MoaD/ThiS family protein [Deltaproteobacteria bacterium]|nr:MoaD/ThiS family protein [Deltaproteobacteria bacterium]